MKFIKGGVTSPKGFKANGIYCGIKRSKKKDLSLIVSNCLANGAAVFTKNSIKAAPLQVSAKHIRNGKIQAFVTNSGNANCFTGKFGLVYAEQMAESVAKHTGLDPKNVFVLSTGIIGKALPVNQITDNMKKLVNGLSIKNAKAAAQGILTTDTRIKESAVELTLGGKKVTIGANAKGSGMTAPNMATMLSHITTDADISSSLLKSALRAAVNETFNCITIDGCMSTNDTVVIMANGMAKNSPIRKKGKEFSLFTEALTQLCRDLACQIVKDGEGRTKFIEINVLGAKTQAQAKEMGLAVANSFLVKTAAFGNNPNWGRVVAAVGAVGIPEVTENNLKVEFSDFSKKDIAITIKLNLGRASAKIFTSDLSYEYVKINVEYN